MAKAVQGVRSILFNTQMYVAMLVMAVLFLPLALASRKGARFACHTYCRWVIWTAAWMVGLRTEVRGTPPTEECVIAAKHQSFFDIIVIFASVPRPRFIMKRELMWAPILGQYALRIGCIPVDRGARGKAVAKMLHDVERGRLEAGQLIIYPQGTRVAPGEALPYKSGTGILYEQLGQPVYPVAVNVGVFWPKRGVMRRPGTAVVEFLDPIPPGLDRVTFTRRLGPEIEAASDRLMAEAGLRLAAD
ncbi:1-acyl-sn-glycerol-3-phosphate acyltransferase [Rhodobacteraceae bacterium CCMM004]|nr:1-acyl-sn-glycerol-3-phosphate acyltransferase [Rhodobacteraceae bacterium CCMM004]